MRFLTFKNIIEYISNMNKDEKINLSDTFDIESRGYESFKSINLDSEISRTTLIKNNNRKKCEKEKEDEENPPCCPWDKRSSTATAAANMD